MRKQSLMLLVVVAVAGITTSMDAQQPSPDMILTNGKIITVDERFSIAQAVAIRGDRVVADETKPFMRDELDQYAPDNPIYMVFSRSEAYLNSKAIEAVGLDKMNQPWIKRDAGGRPTGIVEIAGANAVRNAAKFLDAPNGGR